MREVVCLDEWLGINIFSNLLCLRIILWAGLTAPSRASVYLDAGECSHSSLSTGPLKTPLLPFSGDCVTLLNLLIAYCSSTAVAFQWVSYMQC